MEAGQNFEFKFPPNMGDARRSSTTDVQRGTVHVVIPVRLFGFWGCLLDFFFFYVLIVYYGIDDSSTSIM
jgi:hypothetical protein